MVARIVRQDEAIRKEFQKRILAKVQQEKNSMKQRIDDTVPSFISWAVKPLAGLVFDIQRDNDNNKGTGGEFNVGIHLRLALSKEWILMNDVVVEPEPEVFAQTDHIAIGPPGMFVIETKAWDGAFTGYKDRWKRKEGNKWVPCHSPTRQNLRHVKLISQWLEKTGVINISIPATQWIKPVVVFTRASWLKATDCSMPVLDSALGLALYLKRQKEVYLDAEQIDKISLLLSYPQLRNATPIQPPLQLSETPGKERLIVADKGVNQSKIVEQVAASERKSASEVTQVNDYIEASTGEYTPKIETGRTKGGQDYVRVYGSKQAAEAVRRKYQSKGQKTSPVNKDKYRQGVWYFYLNK